MFDTWQPDAAPDVEHIQYSVECRCGNRMRVRRKHFGRMCRCTKCKFPIYVTPDSVTPPVQAGDLTVPRVFSADEIPIHWQEGDLLADIYAVREILGEGGMGKVYRVEHRGWGMQLAVKCPSPRLLNDDDWLEQFEHECETWINLTPHPNVVECFYVRRLAGIPRLFVEYVKGRDLGHMIDQKLIYLGGHKQAMKRMLDVAIQYCWGLHHAHLEGVVHQDVKPSNLIVTEDWSAKVTDFGLARVWVAEDGSRSGGSGGSGGDSGGDGRRAKGMTGGTPTYRSMDHKLYSEVTHKTDVWSWGVSMIELFAGDVYWHQGSDAMNVLENLLTHGSRYDIIPKMPKSLELLLKECFRREPEKRPADMMAIANRLIDIYREETGEAYPRECPVTNLMDEDVLNNRAVSWIDLGKGAEAEKLWTDILNLNHDHLEALYNRSLYYWRTGRLTDAQVAELLYRICEEQPKEWLPAVLLARVLVERGDANIALQLLDGIHKTRANQREVSFAQAMAQNVSDRDKRLLWEFQPDEIKVTAVSLSFDGWRALTGGADGQIRIWEVATKKCTAVLSGHTDRVLSVSLSEEERSAVSASVDKTVRIWNPHDGEIRHVLKGHKAAVRKALFTRNARHVVSCGEDGAIMLWDAGKGKQLRVMIGHKGSVNSIALSRCGNFLISGSSDCTIRKWDLFSGKCVKEFEHKADSRITSVCVTADNMNVLAGCDKELQIYDFESGRFLRAYRGHRKEIFSVVTGENHRYALTATGMGTIKVWDIVRGQCIRSMRGHAPVSLSRDGRFAISGGAKSDFKVWAMNIDEAPYPAPYIICRKREA